MTPPSGAVTRIMFGSGFCSGPAGREIAAVFTRNELTPSSVAGWRPVGGSGASDDAMWAVSVSPALTKAREQRRGNRTWAVRRREPQYLGVVAVGLSAF